MAYYGPPVKWSHAPFSEHPWASENDANPSRPAQTRRFGYFEYCMNTPVQTHTATDTAAFARWVGLFAGPLLALLCYALLPESFTNEANTVVPFSAAGRATLAVMVWMGTWWLTEAIDISATALLPLAVFPLLGIASMSATATPYANEIIFLFMGGFMLALSMQRWGLDRRIALLTLRLVGTKPPAMIAGFMLITAVLSMWVSNTATAAMMMPIALGVIDLVLRQNTGTSLDDHGGLPREGAPGRNFALSLMLGIAYAASIGGIATIIGSPPNGILVQFMKDSPDFPREISFIAWMEVGGIFTLVFLPIAWLLITFVLYPIRIKRIEGGDDLVRNELARLGPPKTGEIITFIVFICTATLWIIRPILTGGLGVERDEAGEIVTSIIPPLVPRLTDGGIAMMAAIALFILPVNLRTRTFTMNWSTAEKLPWGILILFGGGLSLAAAVGANGVAEFIGAQAGILAGAPTWVLILAVTTLIIFLTELTSNTATTATMVPVLAALAAGLGIAPELLIFPATIAASCAFMMPVATPPNAIVFGTGYITIRQMITAGLWLNLSGILIITVLTMTILRWVLGV